MRGLWVLSLLLGLLTAAGVVKCELRWPWSSGLPSAIINDDTPPGEPAVSFLVTSTPSRPTEAVKPAVDSAPTRTAAKPVITPAEVVRDQSPGMPPPTAHVGLSREDVKDAIKDAFDQMTKKFLARVEELDGRVAAHQAATARAMEKQAAADGTRDAALAMLSRTNAVLAADLRELKAESQASAAKQRQADREAASRAEKLEELVRALQAQIEAMKKAAATPQPVVTPTVPTATPVGWVKPPQPSVPDEVEVTLWNPRCRAWDRKRLPADGSTVTLKCANSHPYQARLDLRTRTPVTW